MTVLRTPRRVETERRPAVTAATAGAAAAGASRDGVAAPATPRIAGIARLDASTKRLARRLTARDIAVIDHEGLDRLSAEELVASEVRCVINASPSCSDRYPNPGPAILVEAGLHLVDTPGHEVFAQLAEGDAIAVDGGSVVRGGRVVARGHVLDRRAVARAAEAAQNGIASTLEDFASNTMSHLREERGLLGEPLGLPEVDTQFRDRAAVVIARGVGERDDFRALERFVRDESPALIGVDGGADTILEGGFVPEVIVGDMDSASDRALRCGAELLVHAYRDGRAPGRARLDRLGIDYKLLPTPGTSEDCALLLAGEKGARLIVSVASRLSLADFLDRGRLGISSTFLTRLRIGDILVDARGLSLLDPPAAARRG
jgi:uncharacterized membrane-anchored protein